jgi:hypothetical protein
MARWLVAVLVLASVSSTASADGFYYSEGFGGARVHDELSAFLPDAARIRVAIGMRHREWAYEGWFAANLNTEAYSDQRPDLVTGGLDIKYIQPVASHLEVYLRGSAMVGGLEGGGMDSFSGRGLGVGAGVQLKGKGSILGLLWWPLFFTKVGPKMTAALWLDSGYEFYRLHGDKPTAIDSQLSTLTFGFALGSDF